MKKIFALLAVVCAAFTASAQYYQDAQNPDILHIRQPRNLTRSEFIIPNIDGYNGYKADLHIHTIYSDGSVGMEERLKDAWKDGLDIMAVTEHLEYRAHEPHMVKWMRGYVKKGAKAENYYITRAKVQPDRKDLHTDLQYPVEHAIEVAKPYDITIIPGIEITRDPIIYGHFNALFTTDNNAIHAATCEQSIRNAKAQGALIMHNHPGWRRKSMNMQEWDRMIYDEKLIDGIEIMNTAEFYPKAITRALKYNLFMSSNSDIHGVLERVEGAPQRNMTFIFAKDKSLASIREALEAHRTIAYSHGTIAGEESLLRKFVEASLEVRAAGADRKGKMQYVIKNKSSVEFLVHFEGGNPIVVKGLSSSFLKEVKAGQKSIVVDNAWYGEDKHIVYNFNL
ncbi:MAG: histidinol-phosphatase [Alistipes sp.]|nr:histidinol-phosphatase [Alistipes sp.]